MCWWWGGCLVLIPPPVSFREVVCPQPKVTINLSSTYSLLHKLFPLILLSSFPRPSPLTILSSLIFHLLDFFLLQFFSSLTPSLPLQLVLFPYPWFHSSLTNSSEVLLLCFLLFIFTSHESFPTRWFTFQSFLTRVLPSSLPLLPHSLPFHLSPSHQLPLCRHLFLLHSTAFLLFQRFLISFPNILSALVLSLLPSLSFRALVLFFNFFCSPNSLNFTFSLILHSITSYFISLLPSLSSSTVIIVYLDIFT